MLMEAFYVDINQGATGDTVRKGGFLLLAAQFAALPYPNSKIGIYEGTRQSNQTTERPSSNFGSKPSSSPLFCPPRINGSHTPAPFPTLPEAPVTAGRCPAAAGDAAGGSARPAPPKP